ncbi:MAG: hypothetical protein WDW36_006360 [Sanguina aurantia]
MHGRPRNFKDKLKDLKAAESYKKKVDAIRTGTSLVLECRKAKRYDAAVLEASSKLLKVVPEIYTLWNHRREALEEVLEAGGQAAATACAVELALTQACLMENPKSYSSWHHRKWVVVAGDCDLDTELALIARTPRNFHAWSYRQFVVQRIGRPLGLELEYSEQLIGQDFSNYSAWHYRTILLPKLHCTSAGASSSSGSAACDSGGTTGPQQGRQLVDGQDGLGRAPPSGVQTQREQPPQDKQQQAQQQQAQQQAQRRQQHQFSGSATQQQPLPLEVLDEEYDMVHQAFATDSQDQSPWMYYRWLVGNSLSHLEAARQADVAAQPLSAAAAAPSHTTATATTSSTTSSTTDHASRSHPGSDQPPAHATTHGCPSLDELSLTDDLNPAPASPASTPTTQYAAGGSVGGSSGSSAALPPPAAAAARAAAAAAGSDEAGVRAVLRGVLAREVGRFEEDHLSVEPDAKWPLLTVARLKEAQARHGLCDEAAEVVMAQVKDIYLRLCELDPLRRGFYTDAAAGKAYVVVSAIGSGA